MALISSFRGQIIAFQLHVSYTICKLQINAIIKLSMHLTLYNRLFFKNVMQLKIPLA